MKLFSYNIQVTGRKIDRETDFKLLKKSIATYYCHHVFLFISRNN